jgi:subtilisin family serine protease
MKSFPLKKTGCLSAVLFSAIVFAKAQHVEVSAGAGIVSGYIWRGQNSGGVSVQPEASLGIAGISLSAWGSVGFDGRDTKEFDFTAGYGANGFSVAVTDYWFDLGDRYFDYAAHTTAHMFEATFGYDFGPASLVWNTFFAGADYFGPEGRRAYSTYIEAGAPFKSGGLDLKAEIGFTPWKGLYAGKPNVVNIGITAGKVISVTETFAIPAFTKIIFNPAGEKCYFVFGIKI